MILTRKIFFSLALLAGLTAGFSCSVQSTNGYYPLREIILTAASNREKLTEEEISKWIDVKPVLFRSSQQKTEIANTNFCPFKKIHCEVLFTHRERYFVGKKDRIEVKKENVKSFLEDLAKQLDKEPRDAKFKVEDGKVTAFVLAENGFRLDIEKSLEIISQTLLEKNDKDFPAEIELAYSLTDPAIKSEDAQRLGLSSLIGEGRSNFRGSPKNRIFNIKVATERFNGILISPQEEFSFVKILGEVDGDHGYLPELVIKHNRTEPEFGGGICQVSTTAFRAAIYSGMKITARTNHAYPVSYYNPQGMDATVYVPKPDLRFINNTPGYVLIQTKIEGTELIFQFYGTHDGRTVEVEGPKIVERRPDGSMKTTFTQIVKDKDGNEIIRDTFVSNYDSPSKYPHPGEEIFTKKPKDWSKKQWEEYKRIHNL